MVAELSSVAEDMVIVHDGLQTRRYDGLDPDTPYEFKDIPVRTLPRPDGELLCRFATVNDLHIGETEVGRFGDGEPDSETPVLRSPPGADPYPEIMNAAAVAEIARIAPAAVIAKGDLTDAGTLYEYRAYRELYHDTFGDRLHEVRGNHDGYRGETFASDAPFAIELPGVICAVLDTVIPRRTTGQITAEQIEWLDTLAAEADRTVLVFGHHQNWMPGGNRSADYFGINPEDSESLIDVIARRPRIGGYFAGHTHRNRVRHTERTGDVPFVEVACVKDYPGSWAEYRVFEGGILQVHRRISSRESLAWSNRCRVIYPMDYEAYAMGSIDDRCFAISQRDLT